MSVKLSLLVALTLFSLGTQAQFLEPEQALVDAGFSADLTQSIVKVEAPNPRGDSFRCSALVASERGHLLLAAHCLELNVFGFHADGSPYLVKNLEVDGIKSDWQVKLISLCRRDSIKAGPQENMGLMPISNCEHYDLAILEPSKNLNSSVRKKCVPIFDSIHPSGELLTLGYPVRTMRRRMANSMGQAAYASFGQVLSTRTCAISNSANARRLGMELSLAQAVEQGEVERAIQTSIDAVPGNSGGPVFDLKARLPVGVISFSANPDGFDSRIEKCDGGVTFVSPLIHLERLFELWKADPLNASAGSFSDFKSDLKCASQVASQNRTR